MDVINLLLQFFNLEEISIRPKKEEALFFVNKMYEIEKKGGEVINNILIEPSGFVNIKRKMRRRDLRYFDLVGNFEKLEENEIVIRWGVIIGKDTLIALTKFKKLEK